MISRPYKGVLDTTAIVVHLRDEVVAAIADGDSERLRDVGTAIACLQIASWNSSDFVVSALLERLEDALRDASTGDSLKSEIPNDDELSELRLLLASSPEPAGRIVQIYQGLTDSQRHVPYYKLSTGARHVFEQTALAIVECSGPYKASYDVVGISSTGETLVHSLRDSMEAAFEFAERNLDIPRTAWRAHDEALPASSTTRPN